jgi:hypothetical protein
MNDKNKNKRKHTAVTDINHANGVVQKTARELLDAFLKFSSGERTIFAGSDETTLALAGWTFQAMAPRLGSARITEGTTVCNDESQIFSKLLVNEVLLNAEKIERQCASAGVLFAKLFLRLLAESGKVNVRPNTQTSGGINDLVKIRSGLVGQHVVCPKRIDQKTGLLKIGAGKLNGVSSAALNLAGLLGSVTVEKYKDTDGGAETIIGRHTGHQFRIDTMHSFLGSLSLGEFGAWEFQEVKVLIIDGVVNTVAEIDKVLLGAGREKQPTLLIASFFDEEVVATVAANNLASKTNIFLCLLPRDSIESVNMANDIAVCCLAQPINSHTGHGMLSFIDYEALATVARIKIIPGANTLIISNPKSHGAVSSRIKELQEKSAELVRVGASNNHARDASVELLNKRITNLMSDRVTVKIPSSRASVLIPEFDSDIRLTKSLLQYGELRNTVAFRRWLATSAEDEWLRFVCKLLASELAIAAKENRHELPGFAPYVALWFASTLAEQYLCADYAVTVVRS